MIALAATTIDPATMTDLLAIHTIEAIEEMDTTMIDGETTVQEEETDVMIEEKEDPTTRLAEMTTDLEEMITIEANAQEKKITKLTHLDVMQDLQRENQKTTEETLPSHLKTATIHLPVPDMKATIEETNLTQRSDSTAIEARRTINMKRRNLGTNKPCWPSRVDNVT